MSTDFLIFYEHVNREVENDSLIKYELGKRGYSCEIMPFDGPEYHKRVLLNNKGKVLVVPWLRTDTNICHYLYLAKKPYKIVNLQWEQISNKALRDCGMDTFSRNAVKAFHLCWGKFSQKILIDKGAEKDCLPIVGAIQQDYNRKLFGHYYYSRKEISEQYSLDNMKPWIIYISSFSLVNVSDKYINDLCKEYGDYFLKDRKLNIDSERITLEWIDKFINEYDCEFIYRPHPTELTSANIAKMKTRHKNFHVISDYSVKQWAKVCDKVNIWISTSNAEITSMDVNYHIIRPIKLEHEQEMESMYLEKCLYSYEEFYSANTSTCSDEDLEEVRIRKKNLEQYYDYNEHAPAYIRIADELESILKGSKVQSFDISKNQKKKSSYIFKRTMFFSCMIYIYLRFPYIISVIPIKASWKEIIVNKAKEYTLGKAAEGKMIRYLEHEQAV